MKQLGPIHKSPGSPNYTHSLTYLSYNLTNMNPPGDALINMYPQELAVIDLTDWLTINLKVPIVCR